MTGHNRMNYGRDPSNAQYQGHAYGNAAPRQLGPARDSGMGGRDISGLRRGPDHDQQLSRRLSGSPYGVVDPRVVSGRGVVQGVVDGRVVSGGRGGLPLPAAEPPILSNQPILNGGVNRLPYDQAGLIDLGGMGSHVHSISLRGLGGVGVHNYDNADSYSLLQQQQVQLSDGSLRTMYSVPELGGALPGEVGMKGPGGFRGGYVGLEEANFGIAAAAQAHKLQQQGVYQGRHIGRDGRVIRVGGWEEDGPVGAPPLSPPRAMPMSPRRDDLVRMMSPRRDEVTPPPPMSPRRDDIPHMMSPRRGDMSPFRSPRRRHYPTVLDYGGRLPQRRGFSPPREDELLFQSRQDFPMSPRRGDPLTPPMSPARGGWDYEGPPLSPPRLTVPMSPRRDSPSRSPVWGRSRHSTKAPSQWDVLPGKGNVWNGIRERQSRRESRHDYYRGPERRNLGYGADIDDPPKRLGQGWSVSRKGEGRYGRGEDEQDVRYKRGSGRSYGDHRYGMANSRPYAYNSVVNQRVGLVTKYIERERAEKAAGRAAKETADNTPKETSRKKPAEDDRPPIDSSRSRSDRRNEKDTLAAAIAKSTAKYSKHVSNNGKKTLKHEKSSAGPAPAAATSSGKSAPPAAGAITNVDRTGGGEKTNASKPSPGNVVGSSAPANGNVAAGSSGQPIATTEGAKDGNQVANDSKKVEASKAETEDFQKNTVAGNSESNSGRQNDGPLNNPANGNSNSGSQPGGGEQREPASKRPSLVMEIERVKKSRKLAEQQKHVDIQEVEETYYDANELSADFVTKMNRAGIQYSQMINDDDFLKKKYQSGGQGSLYCLVCGKGSKTYSNVHELVTHAQRSQVQSNRIDHMGFRKALIDVLKLDIKEPPVSNIETEEMIVWPPVVVVENARTGLGADKRWEGVTNSEMALLLNELGHLHGRAKSIWDKFGHRGIVHVEFDSTLEGLQEAERLHNYFLQNGRGRVQWDIIRPFKTGLPGFEFVPEGPDFSQFDEVTKTNKRVLYGYVALKKDVDKIFSKKQRKKVQVLNRKEVKAKLLARQSGEQVVI